MTASKLRQDIKESVDQVPAKYLQSLADYVRFLSRPSVADQIKRAENEFAKGGGADWRKVRKDI